MGRFKDAGSDDEAETTIDMSPLIDCVFILLIFFIVTTVFVEETGVEVDKPQAATSKDLPSNSILIAVTEGGEVVFDKENIGINRVRAIVKRKLKEDSTMPVIIQADGKASAGLLVRVIDEAERAGDNVTVNIATAKGGV